MLSGLRTQRPQQAQQPHQQQFKYAWNFFHDKSSPNSDYESRLTLLQEDIVTIKTFWEVLNSFPLGKLGLKDSVHFFKRGVKPVWEDPRNVKGGAWTFRIPKAQSEDFWKELLMMAVGEQFAEVVQPGDDICGLNFSVRFNSNLISIWTRRGDFEKTKDGILSVVMDTISPDLKPLIKNPYYKRHSEHPNFSEAVATTKEAEGAKAGD